jgi:hypothetical protein
MVNEIIIPKENIAKTEEIREINTEIPSYEEFLKTYKNDGNLNYADLSGGIGEVMMGYGPCEKSCETVIQDENGNVIYTCTGLVRFSLQVDCLNWAGGGGYTKHIFSTSRALEYAHELERGKYSNVSSEVELKCAILIRDAIRKYERGNRVDGYIKVQGQF